jgi:hypothetical protein
VTKPKWSRGELDQQKKVQPLAPNVIGHFNFSSTSLVLTSIQLVEDKSPNRHFGCCFARFSRCPITLKTSSKVSKEYLTHEALRLLEKLQGSRSDALGVAFHELGLMAWLYVARCVQSVTNTGTQKKTLSFFFHKTKNIF